MEPTGNPYQSPTATSAGTTPTTDGRVRLRINQRLPQICAICGDAAVMKRRMSFVGTARGLFGINHWSSDGAATLMIPLCRQHRHFRRWWPNIGTVLMMLPIGIILIAAIKPSVFGLAATVVLVAADFGFLIWLTRRSLRIRATTVDTKHVVLSGLSPAFAGACADIERRDADRVMESLDVITGVGSQAMQSSGD